MDARTRHAMEPLLQLIRKTETGKDDPASYDVVYGGIPAHMRAWLGKPVTVATVGEILRWHERIRRAGVASTATGAYQIIYNTLKGLARPADHSRLFSADLQDEYAVRLLGDPLLFLTGAANPEGYALRLARTWASFPVLGATSSARRTLSRGQSYYAGDGLNKALISPETVERVLDECRARYQVPAVPPAPRNPFAALFALLAKLFGRK